MSISDFCASATATSSGTSPPPRHSYTEQVDVMFGPSLTSPFPLTSNGVHTTARVRVESVQTSEVFINSRHDVPLSSPFPALHVFSELLARHGALRISIQMNHKSVSSTSDLSLRDINLHSDVLPASNFSGATYSGLGVSKDRDGSELRGRTGGWTSVPGGGPSGVSVRVDFLLDGHTLRGSNEHERLHQRRKRLERAAQEILLELHSRRILLAPVAATSFRQTSRLHPRPFLIHDIFASAGIVSVTYMLPTEGSLWSSEGLKSFLQLMPCWDGGRGRRGLWAVASPLEWSLWLLGKPGQNSVTLKPGAPRRMWVEASTLTVSPSSNVLSSANRLSTYHGSTSQVSLSTGIDYAVVIPPLASKSFGDVTLRSVLPNVDPTTAAEYENAKACPLADSTQLHVLVPSVEGGGRDKPMWETRAVSLVPPLSLSQSIEDLVGKDSVLGSSIAEPSSGERTLALGAQRLQLPPWTVKYSIERRDGQANIGTLRSTVVSLDQACPTHVVVHQVIPSVIKPVWQTLRIFVSNANATSSSPTTAVLMGRTSQRDFWNELEWSDLRIYDDVDGTIRWSFQHVLPPSSSLELSFEYDPLFLNFERFPADPNRGFELPPLVAHLTSGCPAEPDCRDDTCPVASATLYSDTPLILAPVPDMSMPFNVISLTCTIYAFIIGSFIHLIVRKGSERVKFSLHPESKPKPPVQRIKEAVSRRFRVLITRLAGAVKAARRAGDPEERSPEIE